ncbi:MAG: ABC transporter ATP-binding protein [Clostridia bacterium]|nr:ABC transporter ATP-binding protein [Clostridia bacterium]
MIEIRHLEKRFGDRAVLKDFSARLPAGVTALRGPSGSGKSTLIHILLGLIQPDAGEISGLAGKRLSAVFQEDRLLEAQDAAGNLRFANPEVSLEEAERALRALGIEEVRGKPVREFSGGMKRRVAIARAALHRADFVALDEPFTGLDAEAMEKAAAFLRETLRGAVVLCAAHDARETDLLGAAGEIRIGEGESGRRAPE